MNRQKALSAGRIVRALHTQAEIELAFDRKASADLMNEAAREIERLRRRGDNWRYLAKTLVTTEAIGLDTE